MSRASERLRQVFERRYHIAMVMLAIAVTVTFLASYRVSLLQKNRAEAIILATEQRALSQRVAFLVKAIDIKPEPSHTDYLRQELLITVERMRDAHRTLIGDTQKSKSLERFLEPLQGIYFSGYVPFDASVQRFLEDAEAIAAISPYSADWERAHPRRDAVITAATASMMQTHGLVLQVLEAKAERDDRMANVVDFCLWVAVMLLVLIITLVIFRPMSKEITRAFEEVEGVKSQAKRAEAEAVAANEDKGNFFQAASHELKTPLNAILGMTDSLKEKDGAAEFEEEISHISAAGDHLLALLNNILDTHRLSEGELSLQTTTFKLAETISRSLNLARALAGQKGLDFESNIDIPDELGVLGDPARLEQVLNNLLNNAVKFTRAGK
ncbi:MAG: HAMP domain-containing sensor histidine kinase, partial [Pseudomonadota bacterium]